MNRNGTRILSLIVAGALFAGPLASAEDDGSLPPGLELLPVDEERVDGAADAVEPAPPREQQGGLGDRHSTDRAPSSPPAPGSLGSS